MIGNILGGAMGKLVLTGDFDSIATVTPSGTATVTFSNIPQTYQHLQIRYTARDANAAVLSGQTLRVGNGSADSGSNYAFHRLRGDGASATAAASAPDTKADIIWVGNNAGTNTFGAGVVDILDYRDTNKFKTFRSLMGTENNGDGSMWFGSSLWRSTSAINYIEITSTANFLSGCRFALYGIKG